jgi:hypothetical protein
MTALACLMAAYLASLSLGGLVAARRAIRWFDGGRP